MSPDIYRRNERKSIEKGGSVCVEKVEFGVNDSADVIHLSGNTIHFFSSPCVRVIDPPH